MTSNRQTGNLASWGLLRGIFLNPAFYTLTISFLVYLLTLEQDLTWANFGGDGGELITAATTFGIPHPPGYPTYVIIGNLFGRLPIGTVAFRFNLLSALGTGIAAGFITAVVNRHHPVNDDGLKRYITAVSAGLIFAFGSLVWSQAIIAEVYAINLAFVGAFVYCLARNEKGTCSTLLAGILLGLSLTTHLTSALMIPMGLVLVPVRRWIKLGIGGIIGLLPFLLLPLLAQSSSPVIWGQPDTLDRWWWLVSAQLYRPNVFGLPTSEWSGRLSEWWTLFGAQFIITGLPFILLGFFGRFKTHSRLLIGLLLSTVLYTVYAFTYQTNDAAVLLLPAILLLSTILGFGLHFLGKAAIILPFLLLWLNLGQPEPGYYVNMVAPVRPAAETLLETVPPNAIILTAGDPSIAALWYFQHIEGKRPDIIIIDGNLFQFDWYRNQLAQTYPSLRHLTHDDLPGFIEQNKQTRAVCEVSLVEPGYIHC